MTEEMIFAVALAIPNVAERAAYLDRACADNPDLRRQIEELLAAHEGSNLFDRPTVPEPTNTFGDPDATGSYCPALSAEAEGILIAGRYKLRQQIGEGGMGTVWVADQTEPVKRQVAVKLVRIDRSQSKTILARFEAERQAIALMDHPHIAKLLDAGTTETGAPFFVMELVKGIPLNKFCDQHQLPVLDRLNLFMQICSAVQHAHQKGIIHRDLKPSNILVESHDGKPVPKVIDFGLAKATSGLQLTEQSLFTAFGSVMGTPLYMAPGQASFNPLDVDTRADIYALGVILYELLTGTTPLMRETMRKVALDEILRLIHEQDPPSPSSRLSSLHCMPSVAANRQIEPAKLCRFVKGELDWIVMKALSKERDRRYETANGFARDIERFLNHEPVQAGPLSASYRIRKFVRRNRPQVIAASLVLFASFVGGIGTTWGLIRAERALANEAEQRTRAETEAATAKAINQFLLGDLLEQVDPMHGAGEGVTPVQEIRLRTVLDRAAARIEGRFEQQPLVEAAVRLTIGKMYQSMRLDALARPHIERALELRRKHLGEEHLQTMEVLEKLGDIYLNTQRLNQAFEAYSKVFDIRRRDLGEDNDDTVNALFCMGLCWAGRDDERAEPLLTQALAARRRILGNEHPETRNIAKFLALIYSRQQRHDLAEALYVENVQISYRLRGEGHLDNAFHLWALGQHYCNQGKYEQAEPLYRKRWEINRRVLGDDNPMTMSSLGSIGELLMAWGKPAEAEPVFLDAWKKQCRIAGETAPSALLALFRLAKAESALGKYEQAEPKFARVVTEYLPKKPDTFRAHIQILGASGTNLLRLQKFAAAEAQFRDCLAICTKTIPNHWLTFDTRSRLGESLVGQARQASSSTDLQIRARVADWLTEAEALLLSGYQGLKSRETTIPVSERTRISESLDQLIALYTLTKRSDELQKWQTERAKYPELPPIPKDVKKGATR